MTMMPALPPEEPPTTQGALMMDAMAPPVGVLGGHVVENLLLRVIGKGSQQPLADPSSRMGDRSGGSLRAGRIEHLSGALQIETGDQRCEIPVGEPMHCAGRRAELHQMTPIRGEMQISPSN